MKTRTIKSLLVAAFTLAAMSVPSTANAQLGGLVKKAKDKAKEKVEQVVDKQKEEAKKKVKEAKEDAKMKALDTQRPPPALGHGPRRHVQRHRHGGVCGSHGRDGHHRGRPERTQEPDGCPLQAQPHPRQNQLWTRL